MHVCMFFIFDACLPFSLLRTRPKPPCDPPRSVLPPLCGPAGSRVHGNTQSGPCWSAASQPGKDPTMRDIRKEKKKSHVDSMAIKRRKVDLIEAKGHRSSGGYVKSLG